MFQSPQKTTASGDGSESTPTRSSNNNASELSFRADYYGGDFVEDGSFLVLSTDNLSLSPGSPNGIGNDIEVVNEVDERMEEDSNEFEDAIDKTTTEVPAASSIGTTTSSLAKSQVLGEDVESSVESSNTNSMQDGGGGAAAGGARSSHNQFDITLTNVSTTSSVSTDAHLAETREEVNLLVDENKKLTELLADSNEKMKQCITTTERLKTDHEEYRKKHEASRDIINQLKQDNELLRSQISSSGSSNSSNASGEGSINREQQNSIERQTYAISELNERLNTVLQVNGQLNDQLVSSQKASEELRAELASVVADFEEERKKVDAMKCEIDSGRQAIQKFKEHQDVARAEVESARTVIQNLEGVIEEKSKLIESLRRNMEDTVSSMERCNYKLNEKEQQVILLTTKLAAISAETEVFDRTQALEMQCQSYKSDFEKVREEKAKLSAEKDALLIELNAANQQLRATSDTLENLRRQTGGDQYEPEFMSRNDNSATNSSSTANEPLQSPLTSLPTVAGQLVGFVRRELLGWEDQSSAPAEPNSGASDVSGASATGGVGGITGSASAVGAAAAEAVVQQPRQDPIPPCPICRRTFPSLERLQTHASNCGIEVDENPHDPFVFP